MNRSIIAIQLILSMFSEGYDVYSPNLTTIATDKAVFLEGELVRGSGYGVTFRYNLQKELAKSSSYDVLILIDSVGGDTEEADKIIATVESAKIANRVACIVTGVAYSMAFTILSHCDIRLAVAKSSLMFHRIFYYSLPKNMNSVKLRQWAASLDADDKKYAQANMKALRMSPHDYYLFADQEHRWSAQDLFKRGYLHGIIEDPK